VLYAIDNSLAPVITGSFYSGCENDIKPAIMSFYQAEAQQANAEGITWVNAAGDAGPAGCDAEGAPFAISGRFAQFPANIPEVTAVGGSEFDEQNGVYWTAASTVTGSSALSYIPERVWNDVATLDEIWAGGGGASIYFPKPAWQAGAGVPNDHVRDLPDIALSASFSHDGYYFFADGKAGRAAARPFRRQCSPESWPC
jgi:subtilase family serine protease